MSNPYTIHEVTAPYYFVADRGGRSAQAHRLLLNLSRKNPRPDSISIVGERRYGKTSLLQYLARTIAATPDLLTATIDMLGLSPQNPDGFYATLTRSLIRAGALPRDHSRLSYNDFEDFLWNLEQNHQRLLLFIDEFDLVARAPQFDFSFFDNLRSIADSPDLPLVLIVASVAPLDRIAHSGVYGSPFFNIFLKERLVPLSRQEVENLVMHPPFDQVGFGDDSEEIIALAGRHPYFLELACWTAWELREEASGALNMATLRSVFAEKANTHYQYIWQHSSGEEQHILCAMASDKKPLKGAGLNWLIERGYVIAGTPPRLLSAGLTTFALSQCASLAPEGSRTTSGELTTPVMRHPLLNPMPVNPETPLHHLAFVIGVNKYLHQQSGAYILPALQYAEQDAQDISEMLSSLGFEVTKLLGEDATYEAVKTSFERMQETTTNDPNPDSFFVFHFSGHGQIDPSNNETAYLVLYDTDPGKPKALGLEMNQLVYTLIPKVRVPVSLTLLDACHAGFAAGVKELLPVHTRLTNITQQLFSDLRGRMVLAACAGEALAREQASLAHGIFTYYVLRHWRDLDGSPLDNRVTFGTLVDYVGNEMKKNYPDLPLPAYNGIGTGPTFVLRLIANLRQHEEATTINLAVPPHGDI